MSNINRKLFFIINPLAKNGLSYRVWEQIKGKLANIQYKAYFTEARGDATNIVKRIASTEKKELLFIAVGGDGTIHEVINGAISYPHAVVGYIPAGSGNDFARGYQIPLNPKKATEVILTLLNESAESFDAGCYTGKQSGYFINSIGAGFDAEISRKANGSKMKKWLNIFSLGSLIYVFYLIMELFRYQPTTLNLIIDGKKEVFYRTWFVTVSNQPFYGGGMKIAPKADPQDGEFNIVVVHNLSRIKLLFVFISVFWGTHINYKEVDLYKGKNISINYSSPLPAHADGENIGETPLFIKLSKHRWRVLTNNKT